MWLFGVLVSKIPVTRKGLAEVELNEFKFGTCAVLIDPLTLQCSRSFRVIMCTCLKMACSLNMVIVLRKGLNFGLGGT